MKDFIRRPDICDAKRDVSMPSPETRELALCRRRPLPSSAQLLRKLLR
ncbi:hypothetical protein OOT46_09515 [Aquabacterium sp. A7-Y]|nr:hypothetical protein [Aquabacterium sp. A7-Y]MCW7538085.1 hypothetical protein [Aquabacterium sp. A7-Y]